jgi:hypothetical protein
VKLRLASLSAGNGFGTANSEPEYSSMVHVSRWDLTSEAVLRQNASVRQESGVCSFHPDASLRRTDSGMVSATPDTLAPGMRGGCRSLDGFEEGGKTVCGSGATVWIISIGEQWRSERGAEEETCRGVCCLLCDIEPQCSEPALRACE